MYGIEGKVKKPGLARMAIHEGERFIGEEIGGVAIELLQFAAAINHVLRVSGAELCFGILVQEIIVPTHEKAEVIVEPARLRMMLAIEALMPFTDQTGGI